MQSVSPAIMRVIREVPQELKARELSRLVGVREADAAALLASEAVSVREPERLVQSIKEWRGAHEGKKSGGVQVRQVLADRNRARALELHRVGLAPSAIAKMMGLSAHTIRVYLREGTKQ